MDFEGCVLPLNDEEMLIEHDDEWAKFSGQLTMTLVAKRQRRLLYLTNGFPHKCFKGITLTSVSVKMAEDFKLAYDAFKWVEGAAGLGTVAEAMVKRSAFQTTAVQQLVAAFTELHWKPHKDIHNHLTERSKGIISSDPIEFLHSVQKNSGQLKGGKKFRRPERSFAVALASGHTSTIGVPCHRLCTGSSRCRHRCPA